VLEPTLETSSTSMSCAATLIGVMAMDTAVNTMPLLRRRRFMGSLSCRLRVRWNWRVPMDIISRTMPGCGLYLACCRTC
jgi:hypothetical protein